MDRLKKWDKDEGAGPVTEADLAVNAYLEDTLQAARPDYGWLSEETEDSEARLKKSRAFVIDPIDGTRSFIEGSTTWAHSIAVVEDGRPIAAVVYLPLRQKLYSAALGQGATLNGKTIMASRRSKLEGSELLAARPAFEPHHWKSAPPISSALTAHHWPTASHWLLKAAMMGCSPCAALGNGISQLAPSSSQKLAHKSPTEKAQTCALIKVIPLQTELSPQAQIFTPS